MAFYKDDFDGSLLSAQLQILGTSFADSDMSKPVSLGDCLKFLHDLSPERKSFFCEVCQLAQLIFLMRATNAVSNHSFQQ